MKSLFEATKRFRKLSKWERIFIKKRKINAEMPAPEWRIFFERMKEFDLIVEDARSWACALFWLTLLPAAALSYVYYSHFDTQDWLIVVAVILGAVALLWFLPAWNQLRTFDIPNVLHTFVAPAVSILHHDSKPDSSITCRIDLTPLDAKEKQTHKKKGALRRNVTRRIDYHYRNPWISLESTLYDKSKFKFEILDIGRLSKITKRSRSGKTKHKSKFKMKRRTRVTIRPGEENGVAAIPPPVQGDTGPTVYTKARADGTYAVRAENAQTLLSASPDPRLSHLVHLANSAMQVIIPRNQEESA